jgi:branched-chain amino acid transport system substrate-binding protein
MEFVRDLAGRVGPVIGSALACPDVTRPRIQTVIEKFAAVIRDAAANEAQRSDLAQLFDRSVADGRNLVTTGRLDCRAAERRLADLEQSLSPSALAPAAAAPTAPAFAAAPPPASASEIRSVQSAAYQIAKSASASRRPSPAR